MSSSDDDPVVSVLPIHFSNASSPNVHIHQFPLHTRPLQMPPSAAQSGKKIRARMKPKARRLEVHLPVDTRPEVWNAERSQELAQARFDDDLEKNDETAASGKGKSRDDMRFSEIRLRSEQVPVKGVYMLGTVREGSLHLHPVNEVHQLRPSLTYMDVLLRKTHRRRAGDSDSDSDDGPPPDPDDPTPVPITKKESKSAGEAKEVQVSVRRAEEKGGQVLLGGLSAVRREMLHMMREEEDEKWDNFEYCDGEVEDSTAAFDAVFEKSNNELQCKSTISDILAGTQQL